MYIENFDSNRWKGMQNIVIYYVGYETVKKDLKIYSVNPLYLIFCKEMDALKKMLVNASSY